MAKRIDELYPSIEEILIRFKGIGLYFFIFLFIMGMFGGLVKMDVVAIIVNGIALFGTGWIINLTKKGFWEEYLYRRRRFAPPPYPYRFLGGALLGGLTFLYLWLVGGVPILKSLLLGIMGTVGYYLWYGTDPLKPKMSGQLGEVALATLEEGYRKVSKIEQNGLKVRNPALREQVKRIVKVAYKILEELEEHPSKIDKMRRFLIVFLDSVEQVTSSYLEVEKQIDGERFYQLTALLKQAEKRFLEDLEKLERNEVEDFQIDMELLSQELKQ